MTPANENLKRKRCKERARMLRMGDARVDSRSEKLLILCVRRLAAEQKRREERNDGDKHISYPDAPIGIKRPRCERNRVHRIKETHSDGPRDRVRQNVQPRMEAQRPTRDGRDRDENEKPGNDGEIASDQSVNHKP